MSSSGSVMMVTLWSSELRLESYWYLCEWLVSSERESSSRIDSCCRKLSPYSWHVSGLPWKSAWHKRCVCDVWQGYKQRDAFILTQAALPDTVVDFWTMIYDHSCHTIIMLNDADVTDTVYNMTVHSHSCLPFCHQALYWESCKTISIGCVVLNDECYTVVLWWLLVIFMLSFCLLISLLISPLWVFGVIRNASNWNTSIAVEKPST